MHLVNLFIFWRSADARTLSTHRNASHPGRAADGLWGAWSKSPNSSFEKRYLRQPGSGECLRSDQLSGDIEPIATT